MSSEAASRTVLSASLLAGGMATLVRSATGVFAGKSTPVAEGRVRPANGWCSGADNPMANARGRAGSQSKRTMVPPPITPPRRNAADQLAKNRVVCVRASQSTPRLVFSARAAASKRSPPVDWLANVPYTSAFSPKPMTGLPTGRCTPSSRLPPARPCGAKIPPAAAYGFHSGGCPMENTAERGGNCAPTEVAVGCALRVRPCAPLRRMHAPKAYSRTRRHHC